MSAVAAGGARAPRRGRAGRRGFTVVELLVALTIVAVLTAIAVPKFRDVRRRATAAQILGDFDVIRHAVMSFHSDSGYFPPEAAPAAIPRSLRGYLPASFSMTRPQWTLDYENWRLRSRSRFASGSVAIGVSFVTRDRQLGRTAMRLSGSTPAYVLGNRFTFLISGF